MTPLAIIFIWACCIFAKQIIDWFQIEREGVSPRHTLEFWIMVGLAAIHLSISGVFVKGWLYAITLLAFDFFSYTALFDGGLNLMRKKKLLYIGFSSKLDANLWQKHPELYKWSKIIAAGLTVITGVILFIL
jgi:hypothetical protein